MRISFYIRYAAVKTFWFFAKPVRRCYRYFAKPEVRAAKVVVIHGGRVLLVKPTYGHKRWSFPGGRVKRWESYAEGARRELWEEAGIKIGALVFLFQYKATGELLRSTVRVFAGRVEDCAFRIDGIEIGEAGWFDLDKLPEHRNSRVDEALRHLAR